MPRAGLICFRTTSPLRVRLPHQYRIVSIGQLVADGFAEWDMFDNGNIQLRFNTGETFLLAETVIVRLA
jgi:hypothetical protein